MSELRETIAALILYWRKEAETWDRRDANEDTVTWVTTGEMLRRCARELETNLPQPGDNEPGKSMDDAGQGDDSVVGP
jgi:hypothetical protein